MLYGGRGNGASSHPHVGFGFDLRLRLGRLLGDGRPGGRFRGGGAHRRREAIGCHAAHTGCAQWGAHGFGDSCHHVRTQFQACHTLLNAVQHRDFTQLGVASKARLSVRDGPTQRAGGVTVAVTVDRALGGLALRDTGSPGGKVCISREEVEAMLAQEGGGVPQGTGLAKHTVREEVRLAIAHLSIGGQVGHRGVSCCGPGGLSQRVRETNGWSIVAGHVGVRHWLVAVILICLAA